MATDYRLMEQEFVAGLADDTGRDLADWMAAISASGLSERNEIIDWLRLQGFQFSWASWLERIHHNGGRLIYADGDDDSQNDPSPASPQDNRRRTEHREVPAASAIAHKTTLPDAAVTRLLQEAKGLKPLAELVLREVARHVDGVAFEARPPLIFATNPTPFLALLPNARKLRLYAAFPKDALGGSVRTPDATLKGAAPFPGMLLLDDARQIDAAFARTISALAGGS